MKRHLLGVVFSIALLAVTWPPAVMAEDMKSDPEVQKQIQEEATGVIEEQEKRLDELKKAVNQDVVSGLNKVREAIKALDEKRTEEALKLLKEAVGSFDVALAADPNLGFVPVNSVISVHTLYTTPDDLERELAYIEKLLDEGRVQEARRNLSVLRSDVSVITTVLPMHTYPDAIRKAVREIVDGEVEQAKKTLALAMNTLVQQEDAVAPIPLLTAKALIDKASETDKADKEKVKEELELAKDQLRVAMLLGYVSKDSDNYKEIASKIDELEEEIEGENKVEKLYEELKASFSSWVQEMTR
ncbi:MAG: hypothetical protein Kow0099_36710 [Candidatus Abyssubacteria bacterium]